MTTNAKKEFTQDDWEKKDGLRDQLSVEIIMEYEGIPKLLMSPDAQFIAVQVHPEAYIAKDFIEKYPEAIRNKGIYQFFFSKILQYHMTDM